MASLPFAAGKAVKLEIKTAKPTANGHYVEVDLGQLWEYWRRPLGLQPYYVFPIPPSTSQIDGPANRTWRGLQHQSELAFRRSGAPYFADRMTVLTTSEVARLLHTKLLANGSRDRGTTARLLEVHKSIPAWTLPGEPRPTPNWFDFWDELRRCGNATWPQRFVVPSHLVPTGRIDYQSAVTALRQSSQGEARQLDTAVCLMPTVDGAYATYSLTDQADPHGEEEIPAPEAESEPELRRVEVFLSTSALTWS